MAYIKSDQKLMNHPKTLKLMSALRVGKAQTIGHLHILWWWCVDHAQDGVLSDLNDAQIASAAEWGGDAKVFVTAMIEAGFLDRGEGVLTVHDWDEWKPEVIRSRHRRLVVDHESTVNRPRIDHETTMKRPENDQKTTISEQYSSSSVVLSFPVSGTTKTWELREDMLLKLKELYPAVDVLTVCKKALFWLENNPKNKKTAKRMFQWLASVWCEREQNRFHPTSNKPNQEKEFQEELSRRRDLNERADRLIGIRN